MPGPFERTAFRYRDFIRTKYIMQFVPGFLIELWATMGQNECSDLR